ncbi:MAG: hypothetical protein LBL81_03860, partial [Tannerella sp.]|nr:hypothetical protein [Tannerella sp.]
MEVLILLVFLVGYGAIVLEHSLKIDKASSALVMGILSWTIYILSVGNGREDAVLSQLNGEMSEAAGILFFL